MEADFCVTTAILGAGIAGLGAAHFLQERGDSYTIFEARDSAGGILDNFTVEGYRFDNAVHLSFAHEQKVRSIFDLTSFTTHKPLSRCFDDGYWLKHPVQNNLQPLSTNLKVDLIKSFIERPERSEIDIDNYEQWLTQQYGKKIAERYPVRYTRKYWDTEASSLSTSWIGDRMRQAHIDEILRGSFESDTPNHYYTKEMRYPKEGGYKSFIQPLIDASEIKYQHSCIKLRPNKKVIEFSNGKTVKYSKIINTIPLPLLVSITEGVPSEVETASNNLTATSIDLISVGFNRYIDTDLWFYIYDEDIFASRAYSPSQKSVDNAPEGCSSLQFEVYSRGTSSKYTRDQLIANVIYALKKMDIAHESDIAIIDHRRLKYGNVIFDADMTENRDKVHSWFNDNNIVNCGRFGAWDYLWSNQSFISGYEAAEKS
jgi:protoporphyrinogen oxidase